MVLANGKKKKKNKLLTLKKYIANGYKEKMSGGFKIYKKSSF
jgi:hypothetical protein